MQIVTKYEKKYICFWRNRICIIKFIYIRYFVLYLSGLCLFVRLLFVS